MLRPRSSVTRAALEREQGESGGCSMCSRHWASRARKCSMCSRHWASRTRKLLNVFKALSKSSKKKSLVYINFEFDIFMKSCSIHFCYLVIAYIVEAYVISYCSSCDCSLTNFFNRSNSNHFQHLRRKRLNNFEHFKNVYFKTTQSCP